MGTDAQCFNEGELIERQFFRPMQFGRRHNYMAAHATIDMHTQYAHLGAAIGFAMAAGDAGAAMQVWLYRAAVAHCHAMRTRTQCQHFHAKLMAQNAGVGEKRLLAAKCMDIRTAHAHPGYPYQRLARAGWRGVRAIDEGQFAGVI
jgi:hypothetical protein